MSSQFTQEQRSAAASALAHKAEMAQRLGSPRKATELLESALHLDPSPARIRAWLLASAASSTGVQHEAFSEVASWF